MLMDAAWVWMHCVTDSTAHMCIRAAFQTQLQQFADRKLDEFFGVDSIIESSAAKSTPPPPAAAAAAAPSAMSKSKSSSDDGVSA